MKPIYKTIKVWHIALLIIVIGVSAGGKEENKDSVKKGYAENSIEADWSHKLSQNMGGYNISVETELRIVSAEDNDEDNIDPRWAALKNLK